MTFDTPASRLGLSVFVLAAIAAAAPVAAQTPTEMGSGIAWLDCDNDGDLDLMFLTPTGEVELRTYDPDTDAFTDVSDTALPDAVRVIEAAAAMGVACADFDNDGMVDIFISMEGPNHLLMNNGDGTFRATSRASGISNPGGETLSSSVAALDYNLDGRVDIYVGNYMGRGNRLYRNDGIVNNVVKFTDVAGDLGVNLPIGDGSSWTLGVAVADYDNDGDPDLYVANDYNGLDEQGGLSPGDNILYRNNGDGTFTDVSVASGANDRGWAMGVVFGDYDNDGWMDIFLANFWEDALLHNNGDGTFTDVTREVGIITDAPDEWHYNGWGTAFLDYDNDGDLDIHVANGYILNDQGQVINEPNQLWENVTANGGPTTFRDVSAESGMDDPGDGRGAAYGDFNRDGYVDVLLLNNGFLADEEIIARPKRMLHVNQGDGTFQDQGLSYGFRTSFSDGERMNGTKDTSGNRWLQIGLAGRETNTTAIGARVIVKTNGVTRTQDVGASSYCSTNSPYLHFGLGAVETVDEVLVRFPSGKWARETDVAVNQFLDILEPEVTPVRLLAFGLASEPGGVRARWSYADDGDLAGFTLKRTLDGTTVVVAAGVLGADGRVDVLDPGVPAGRTAVYTLDALLRDGTRETLRTASFRHRLPAGATLGQGFPNPFRTAATIPLLGATGGAVEVTIFDASGRRIRGLRAAAGDADLRWDGNDDAGRPAPAGTYFYRLSGAVVPQTLKLIKQP